MMSFGGSSDVAAVESPEILRVLMVSTSYPTDLNDWRGLFMRHMAFALGRRADVQLRLWAPPGETHENVAFELHGDERARLSELMAAGGIAHMLRRRQPRGFMAALWLLRALRRVYRRNADADLFHANWLQSALPVPHGGKPLLVTVLGTDMQLMRLPMMRLLLRRAFRDRRVAICPNADWMLPQLREAFGDVAEVAFIPFGIDPRWYAVERNITSSPMRWLAVTRLTQGKLGPLLEWAAPLFRGAGRELHLFGPMQEDIVLPDWVRYHGPASPDVLREQWFPVATGLITLSQHSEGRPQVMLEAMAAGLPIIASDIPAHTSFLRHGETGWLCGGPDDLVSALAELEKHGRNGRIGAAARDWARQAVGTWDDCATRYVRMYRRLQGGAP